MVHSYHPKSSIIGFTLSTQENAIRRIKSQCQSIIEKQQPVYGKRRPYVQTYKLALILLRVNIVGKNSVLLERY